jgi:arylsulfatase A-like enzyme
MDSRNKVIWIIIFGSAVIFFVLTVAYYSLNQPENNNCKDCNLIIISLDDLRGDRLSYTGYHRKTSPNIDELAKDSIVFLNTLAQSSKTESSHKSMLTGTYVAFHRNNLDNTKTLAEYLKEKGYKTAAIVGGGLMKRELGFDRGFDLYDDDSNPKGHIKERKGLVMDWLEENHDKKFFLFLHFYDIHYPYPTEPEYDGLFTNETAELRKWVKEVYRPETELGLGDEEEMRYLNGLYDGGIVYTDYHLVDILDKMRELGLFDNSIIVLTSDHGESLGENDYHFGHVQLKQMQLKVPLLIHLPSRKHKIIRSPVSVIDITPTVLDYLGIEQEEYVHGRSLKYDIEHDEGADAGIRIANKQYRYSNEFSFYCTDDQHSITLNPRERGDLGWVITLYDLSKDPYESNPILKIKAASNIDKMTDKGRKKFVLDCVQFTGKILEESRYTKKSSETKAKLDKDTLEELRDVGYVM